MDDEQRGDDHGAHHRDPCGRADRIQPGFVMWIVLGRWLRWSDTTLTTIAVGSIIAEGLGGVLQVGLLKFVG